MTPPQQYVVSLYWSFTTMTTLGYGDITPQNSSERIFAMACMLFGAIGKEERERLWSNCLF